MAEASQVRNIKYLKVVVNVFLTCLHSPNERESAFRNPGLWNPEYSSRKTESHCLLKSRLRNPWHGIQNPRQCWILLHGVITWYCVSLRSKHFRLVSERRKKVLIRPPRSLVRNGTETLATQAIPRRLLQRRELTTAPPCSTVLIHLIMSLGQILLVRSYNDRRLELDSILVGNTGLQPLARRRKQQTRWSSHQRSNTPSDCAILLLIF